MRWVARAMLVGVLGGGAGQDARAQQPEPTGADTSLGAAADESVTQPPSPADNTAPLKAVTVTARRKEESAQQVPISMGIIDGDALNEAGLSQPTDLPERVPNLLVTVPNPRLTSYTIRGLGSSSINDGMESSVGLFLDGVYLGRQGMSIFDLIDIERIEVLRGPQGTLFGKNTTAGVLNIVTKAPSQNFQATLEDSLGNYDSRMLRGSITGPLFGSRQLAGRLTGYSSQRDGMIENVHTGHGLNDRNKWGLRGQALWTPSGDLSWRFIAEYGKANENCCVYPLVAPVRPAVQARDDFMGYRRPSLNPYDRLADSDARTHIDMEQRAVSAEANWDISDRHRLTSISAWRDWRFVPENDDATPLSLTTTGTRNRHRQLSQELRLASNFKSFDSVAGLYYLHQQLHAQEQQILGSDMAGWTFGGLLRDALDSPLASRDLGLGHLLNSLIPPATLTGTRIATPYGQTTESAAAFGSIDWHLSDRLDLTTGLRYTHEWRRAEVSRARTGGCSTCTGLSLLTPLAEQLGRPEFTVNGLLDQIAGGEYRRKTKLDDGDFSGQLALTYRWSPRLMTYASLARGYKAGGINLGATGESVKPTFDPEQATSFEVGAKGRWGRALWSTAVYHTEVDDYQALTFDEEQTIIPNPRQVNLLNIGKVRLQGVEGDISGILAPGLLARAGLAYSRAITAQFGNAPNEVSRDNDKNLSGHALYNAPRWTGTAGLEYGHALTRGLEGYGAIDYSYRGHYWGTLEHGEGSEIDGYGLTNLRLGLRSESGRWDVALWARNLLDKDYVAGNYALYGVGDYGAYAGDPRTYGLTLRANFD